MGIYDNWTYTDLHQLNLDWVLKEVKNIKNKTDEIDAAVTESAENADIARNNAEIATENASASSELLSNATELLNDTQEAVDNVNVRVQQNVNDIQTLSARVSSFENLAEGSTTGDAELIDGRISEFNGTVYANIGDAIRGQISELYDSDVFFGKRKIFPVWNPGFIRPTTLEIVTTNVGPHLLSEAFYVPPMTILYVPVTNRSLSVSMLTLTDQSGVPIQMLIRGSHPNTSNGQHIKYPFIDGGYVRIGSNISTGLDNSVYMENFTSESQFLESDANYAEYRPGPVEWGAGPITANGLAPGATYKHSSYIVLPKGMTMEYWACGSTSNVALSEWDTDYTTKYRDLSDPTSGIVHTKYVSDKDQFVRLSAQIDGRTDGVASTVLPEELLYQYKIYYEPFHNIELHNKRLYGSKVAVMGDSLVAGNRLGKGGTWCANLANKYNLNLTNLGINGNTVAIQSIETSNPAMVERIDTVPADSEYFVLIGGANDKRLSVPLGTIGSTDTETFMGALNTIITNIRIQAPKAKLLFLSTYNRFASVNSLGLTDKDYADAMIEVCSNRGVRCFNNFKDSNIDFTNTYMDAWLDENNNVWSYVNGVKTLIAATHHFGLEGYAWITPIYEQLLLSI